MTTKTITANGKTITVEMVRNVQDKVSYADGYNITTGREVIEYTVITLDNGKNKIAANHLDTKLNPKFDAKGIAGGAVAKLGNAYLLPETYQLVAALLAEVEAETPKSDEQIEIEAAQAKALEAHAAWYNSPEEVAARKLAREMNRSDSDY